MSNLLEKFIKWESETPDAILFQQPFKGEWKTWTYREAGMEIRKLAAGINALYLPSRSKIALISKNCAHWIMADLAIIMSGNISVPLYPTLTADSIREILEHSDARLIIVGKLDNFQQQKSGIPSSVNRLGVKLYGTNEELTWEDVVSKNQPLTASAVWDGDEVFTIKYTSGTTGGAKGVMHSMNAFNATTSTTLVDLKLPLHPRLFSYLPLSHIAERVGIEVYGLYSGGSFSFPESLESFPKDLAYIQPQFFFAVPRIWGKFREKILEKIPQSRLDTLLSIPLVNFIIKKSIRKKLGLDKAIQMYSGAAPISVELLEWYQKLGITIFQALGMTEDSIYAHCNRHGANKLGTVGLPLTGLLSRFTDEGELLVKSGGLMKGYYKNPELTKAAFDEEGYFRTGDICHYDNDGNLVVTGRVKDQFKTSKGKFISPSAIETQLLSNTDIEQVCVVGIGLPQPIVLVVLSAAGKARNKIEISKSMSETMAAINLTLQDYERLGKVIIMKEDWSIDNGLITPTLKVKRNQVEKKFQPFYDEWQSDQQLVIYDR